MLERLGDFVSRNAGMVVLASLLFVIGINVAVPQLEEIIAKDSTPFMPSDAKSEQAFREMSRTFGTTETATVVYIVAVRESGLSKVDWQYLSRVGARLAGAPGITAVQDVNDPDLREAITSDDGQAAYLQVGMAGETGAPAATAQIDFTRKVAHESTPDGLEVAITGPGATVTDMQHQINNDVVRITVATVGVIALLLFLIYRSWSIMAVILGFIGISLAAARATAAFFGMHVFAVSTFTASLLIPVVLGAATNYAIFLLSRYHEFQRDGQSPEAAAAMSTARIGAVVLGSGLTVVIGSGVMIAAELGFFRTTGPAIAVGIAITLALSLTFFPALLVLAGRRGWASAPEQRASALWQQVSAFVVGKPGRTLVAGLLPLLLLASLYSILERSFDERSPQSADNEANVGYALAADHFPENELLADYVLIHADRDLRNARDLAALELAAASVARIDGVQSVRTVTRPLGTPIAEANVGHQAGIVGDRIGGAADQVKEGREGSRQLADGAGQLAEGADQLADGAGEAAAGSKQLTDGSRALSSGLRALLSGAGEAQRGAAELRAGARELAHGLREGHREAGRAVAGLRDVYQALQASPLCGLDPACRGAREGVRQIWEGERDQLLPGLQAAARGADQLAAGLGQLDGGLAQLRAGIADAYQGADRLAAAQARLNAGLRELASGAGQLADGSGEVASGTRQVDTAMAELASGLEQAARFLKDTERATRFPEVGGFYLPPQAFADERFAGARDAFVSPDGRSARIVVIGATDAMGPQARERVQTIAEVVERSFNDTRLDGAEVHVTGMAAANADIEELSAFDFKVIAIIAITLIFLVLVALLRSIVAPLVLLATVLLSYLAAVGLGVLVFQLILGIPFHWSVPVIAFVILVAVGADYNMLLAKRMREEAPDGNRAGLTHAVAATGAVITSAGIVFAAAIFSLMSGSITTLQETGFVIGAGLLLDAFIVRSTVVPAFASIFGRNFWWPNHQRA